MITCHNNLEKSSTTKINEHRASGYSMFTQCSFDATKNKLDFYRGKDCMERFWKDLKEHVLKIIDHEKKKEMIPLTYKENKSYKMQEVCYTCNKIFNPDKNYKNVLKLYHKIRDYCHYTEKYRGAARNICSLR